jgi:hypothetical protein
MTYRGARIVKRKYGYYTPTYGYGAGTLAQLKTMIDRSTPNVDRYRKSVGLRPMGRKRRRRHHRHNPVDNTVLWAIGLTALAGAIGVGIYFATRKQPPPLQAAPPGGGGTVSPPGSTGPVVAPQTVAVASAPARNNASSSAPTLENRGIHAPRTISESGLAPQNQLDPNSGNY